MLKTCRPLITQPSVLSLRSGWYLHSRSEKIYTNRSKFPSFISGTRLLDFCIKCITYVNLLKLPWILSYKREAPMMSFPVEERACAWQMEGDGSHFWAKSGPCFWARDSQSTLIKALGAMTRVGPPHNSCKASFSSVFFWQKENYSGKAQNYEILMNKGWALCCLPALSSSLSVAIICICLPLL